MLPPTSVKAFQQTAKALTPHLLNSAKTRGPNAMAGAAARHLGGLQTRGTTGLAPGTIATLKESTLQRSGFMKALQAVDKNALSTLQSGGEIQAKITASDSGIGGAMTVNLVPANVDQFGHNECLPIGQKDLERRISYTAHMALHGLVHSGSSDVIVACNTASVQKEPACDMIVDHIMRQADDLDKGVSVYQDDSDRAQNVRKLAAEIIDARSTEDPTGRSAITSRVHEIITPTSQKAATAAFTAMTQGDNPKDTFLIKVDSTRGTVVSESYPEKISNFLAQDLAKEGFHPVETDKEGAPKPTVNVTKENDKGQYTPEQLALPSSKGVDSRLTVNNQVFQFQNNAGETKTLFVQGRGPNAWVPAIEGNALEKTAGDSPVLVKDKLAEMVVADASALTSDMMPEHPHWSQQFDKVSDYSMMCCTHFPAIAGALKSEMVATLLSGPMHDLSKDDLKGRIDMLTQDAVVLEIYNQQKELREGENPSSSSSQFASNTSEEAEGPFTTHVFLGSPTVDEATAEGKKDVLGAVADATEGVPGEKRNFTVQATSNYDEHAAAHKEMTYQTIFENPLTEADKVIPELNATGMSKGAEARGREIRDDRFNGRAVLPAASEGISSRVDADKNGMGQIYAEASGQKGLMLWERDRTNADSSKRADAKFKGFLPDPKVVTGKDAERLSQSRELLQKHLGANMNHDAPEILGFRGRIVNLAQAVIQGENRGVDILAATMDIGGSLENAALNIADRLLENSKIDDMADRKPIGIVTGFTVVDAEGNSLGGENDGPPGAVTMAKLMLDQGTPVTVVCDTGSESSLLAAAQSAGLIEEDNNNIFAPELEKKLSECVLKEGFNVQVVDHKPDGKTETSKASVDEARKTLENQSVDLLISIERPGPSSEGKMSNMSAQSIDKFNADMSPLFESQPGQPMPWTTIGIGDGGNEIGMGSLGDRVSDMRKPDYTPVVRNGDKIAAATKTDTLVPASASNNGGVAVAIAANEALRTLQGADQQHASSSPEAAQEIIDGYKKVIADLESVGMSIDGVNKTNALSVDGRPLVREEGAPRVAPGHADATHDDMFDTLVDAVRK